MSVMHAEHGYTGVRAAYPDAIAGLIGLALAMGVGRFAFTPLLPLMVAEGDITLSGGAWLAAANYFGYLVGALAALCVRGRAATFIRAALLATAVVTLGMGFTREFAAWLALRWLAGFASAFLLVFISAWSLERISTVQRPLLAAAPFSGVGGGIFVVGLICVVLQQAGLRAPGLWIALGVFSLLTSIAVSRAFARDGGGVLRANAAAEIGVAHRRTGWRFVLCYGFFGFGYIVPATFLPAMARESAANGWAMDLSWPVFGLAACLSTFVAARASGRGSALQVWRNAQIAMALGVALPAFSTTPAALIAAAIFVGGTFMVVTMLGMQTARRFAGADAKSLMAAMTAGFATGQLAGPLTVPYLIGPDGNLSTVLLLASAMLLAGVCLLPLSRHGFEGAASSESKENTR
jgi:hypothetical protein